MIGWYIVLIVDDRFSPHRVPNLSGFFRFVTILRRIYDKFRQTFTHFRQTLDRQILTLQYYQQLYDAKII